MNKKITVNFPFLKRCIETAEGTKISEACSIVGYPLNLVCGGKGNCKKCGVDIEENGEIKRVLSCQTYVYDGLNVMLRDEEQKLQILTSSMLDNIPVEPSLGSLYFTKDQLKTELGGNNWDTLSRLTDNGVRYPNLNILRKLSFNYHHRDGIRLIIDQGEILDVVPGSDKKKVYGIAFDLGTTSAVGYLYDMEQVAMIGVSSTLNKQTELGGDVITRISYAITDTNSLLKMQKLATDTLNEIIEDICSYHKINTDDVYFAVICGNSTMQHLLLGLYPEYLGILPFSSTIHSNFETNAKNLCLKINSMGKITFLPLLGGFVGADTTAALVSLPKDNKVRLMLDLGTNGELAIGNNTCYKVSSTACGPALEGAQLTYGMRGTHGAIERMFIENGDITYNVIGNEKPQGICGSGVIDLVSVLYSSLIINGQGGFENPSTIKNQKLARRLVTIDGKKSFIIAFEDETQNGQIIYFSQTDIRQVQLAKGAIYTGCSLIIKEYGIKGEDLEEIVIAGAFGNYIDVKNAQSIGMFPCYKGVPVRSLGNAAGTGAQMYLISKKKQAECAQISNNAIFIELANNPGFMEQYIMNLNFPTHLKQ